MSEVTDEAGIFSAPLNRAVMGSWLAATLVSVTLEALALIMGVGSMIDWILLIAFAGISAVIAMHVFDKRPVLIVTPQGIHDRRISSRMIPWDEMLWHRLEVHGVAPVLGVGLTDKTAKEVGVHRSARPRATGSGPCAPAERAMSLSARFSALLPTVMMDKQADGG